MHWLAHTPLLGLDTETTGLDITHDRPVSIGMTWHHHATHAPVPGFPMDVNPGGSHLPLRTENTAIHGITTERALRGTPLIHALRATHDALLQAAERGAVVVAAHARFDLSLLASAARAVGLPTWDEHARAHGTQIWVLDPLLIDQWWDRHRPGRRRMRDVCERFAVVNDSPHEAQADARAAVDVARALGELATRPTEELGELAVDPWAGARLAELLACRTPGALHRLQQRWHRNRQRVYGGGRPGWPLATT